MTAIERVHADHPSEVRKRAAQTEEVEVDRRSNFLTKNN